jgi:glutamyl-tRNA synthetase
MKMPRNRDIRFEDIIRGWVVVNTNNLDDKVLFKSDGMPTYHLANIVDDHLMEISHVIRGEEWLPSAPLHYMLYEAFGWDCPQFAHLPLLLRPDGNGKLSKRDGDRLGFPVFPTDWTTSEGELYSGYREKGYFPGAFINMLALLGWNPGTPQEIFTLDELAEAFSLDRVSKAGAKFDPDKTRWFQQQYLRACADDALAVQLAEITDHKYDLKTLEGVARLMKERATFVKDMISEGSYLLTRPASYDEQTVSKKWKEGTSELMKNKGLGVGAVLPLFRLVITGTGMGPSMFDISEFLGKEECINRMKSGISEVESLAARA